MLFGFKEKREIRRNVEESIEYVNKIIYDDELWKGRFYMKLDKLTFQKYEDNSGFTAQIKLKLVDLETDLMKHYYAHYTAALLRINFSDIMNNFIVKDIRPANKTREESIDYRGAYHVE